MTRFRAYLAVSLDGYIADAAGGVEWLDPFNDPSLGFETFHRSIDAVIVGRTTYEQGLGWGAWTNPEKRTIVMTRRPLEKAPSGIEAFTGDVHDLAAGLARDGVREVWLMGGGRSLEPFVDADLVDRWELFVIPVLLGEGVPLFPRRPLALRRLALTKVHAHRKGVVELHYEREKPRDGS